jgi:DNA-binding PadR family transcriptional regulator
MNSIEQLLENWESVYKKGLLTFWLLLLLDEKPSYPYEMSAYVQSISQGMMTADENSIYRAINRFEEMGLVTSQLQESKVGPQRKYYRLTLTGRELLRRFSERNILIFQSPPVAERIQHVTQNGDQNGS